MNVGEIKIRVKRQFGDESQVQVTDDDILRWINDGMREIAFQNDLLETKATTDLISGQAEYTLPNDLLALRAIRLNNYKLQSVSLQEMDEYVTNYESPTTPATGTPECFSIWANKFTLYPLPNSASAGGLMVYYTRRPSKVLYDTDEPDLPHEYHNRIVEYVLQQAYELDEDWVAWGNKSTQLADGLTLLKESSTKVGDKTYYPMITVLPDDADCY